MPTQLDSDSEVSKGSIGFARIFSSSEHHEWNRTPASCEEVKIARPHSSPVLSVSRNPPPSAGARTLTVGSPATFFERPLHTTGPIGLWANPTIPIIIPDYDKTSVITNAHNDVGHESQDGQSLLERGLEFAMVTREDSCTKLCSQHEPCETEAKVVDVAEFAAGLTRFNSRASLNGPGCCRICQCDADEPLINPCLCCGSVKWMHESCLIHWMKTSAKDFCEICHTKIEIKRRKKSFWKWKAPTQRPTPVLWVLVFITAIGLNLASVIKDASRLCVSTPCIVFYAVGCVGVILGTLFLMYWSKRAKAFLGRWIEQNEDWYVTLPLTSPLAQAHRVSGKSTKNQVLTGAEDLA